MSAAYEALREAAELEAAPRRAPERPLLRVDLSTSSIAAGADLLWEALEAAIAAGGHDVELVRVGTLGMSWLEPVVELERDGAALVYGPVEPADAAEWLAAALADDPVEAAGRWLIGSRSGRVNGAPPLADGPFWALQERRLMQRMGVIDPERISEAIADGAYAALDRALTLQPIEICDLVEAAGVGGRGGGGFPAGRKWKFLLGAPGPTKYLVCNADEGDPGAFVNRVLMESDPHLVSRAWRSPAGDRRRARLHLHPRRIPALDRADGAGAAARRARWACWASRCWARTSASSWRSRAGPAPMCAARRPG